MVKRAVTPTSSVEEEYLVVSHPYPLNPDWEIEADVIEFARWIAHAMGSDDQREHFYAFYHKPKARDMVILEIGQTYPKQKLEKRLLGQHEWSKFLASPRKEEDGQKSGVFYCLHKTGRETQKDGWKRVAIQGSWFKGWDRSQFKPGYPQTSWCKPPVEDQTNKQYCRPLPVAKFSAPAPVATPVVGSKEWLKARAAPSVTPKSLQGAWADARGGSARGRGRGGQPSSSRPITKPTPSSVTPVSAPSVTSPPTQKRWGDEPTGSDEEWPDPTFPAPKAKREQPASAWAKHLNAPLMTSTSASGPAAGTTTKPQMNSRKPAATTSAWSKPSPAVKSASTSAWNTPSPVPVSVSKKKNAVLTSSTPVRFTSSTSSTFVPPASVIASSSSSPPPANAPPDLVPSSASQSSTGSDPSNTQFSALYLYDDDDDDDPIVDAKVSERPLDVYNDFKPHAPSNYIPAQWEYNTTPASTSFSELRTDEDATDPELKADLWAQHEKKEAEAKKPKLLCNLHHKECSKAICQVYSDQLREANRKQGQGGGGDGSSRGNDRGGRGKGRGRGGKTNRGSGKKKDEKNADGWVDAPSRSSNKGSSTPGSSSKAFSSHGDATPPTADWADNENDYDDTGKAPVNADFWGSDSE